MDVPSAQPEPAYHLLLDGEEVPLTAQALRLLISDGAHQPEIRRLAREVLAELERAGEQPGEGPHSIALTPPQMKITHSALRLLLDDSGREQAREVRLLHAILGKLPDEHAIRAIVIE